MTNNKFLGFLLASAIALLTFLTSCALPVASAQDRTFLNLSLNFLGEYQLPKQTFKNTPIGGLSALAYDRQRNQFYAVSDDRSQFAPARFYTLKLTLNTTQGLKVVRVAFPEGVGSPELKVERLLAKRSSFAPAPPELAQVEGLEDQATATNLQPAKEPPATSTNLPYPSGTPLRFALKPSTPVQPTTPSIGIQKIDIENVTFLSDKDGKTYPKNTIDPEGIALSPQQSVFVSSEGVVRDGIPPFVKEFDLKTGRLRQSLPIPERFIPDATGEKQQRGVQDNLAFESLTLSPTGSRRASAEPFRLFTATESALVQDLDPVAPPTKDAPKEIRTKCRLLHYLLSDGPPLLISEYLYRLDPPPSGAVYHGLTDLLALDQGGHFLSLERSFGLLGFSAKIFQVATGGATDTSNIASLKGEVTGVEPVKKKLLLDLIQLGITLDNLEGMTLGPRLPDGTQSLVLVSDNNFNDAQVNQFLLFRLGSGR